jgi:hypothetical protein
MKKMRTDAVRVTVGVLQGEVIVLFGVFVVAGDCWGEVLKGSHQQVVQKELRVFVHALAGGFGRSRVRGVGFACRVVVDQTPGSGVRSRVDSQIEAGHHLFGRFLEAQKDGAFVCMVGVLLDRGTGLHLGEVETGMFSSPRTTSRAREKKDSLVTNQRASANLTTNLVKTLRWRGAHNVGGQGGPAAVGAWRRRSRAWQR